MNYWGYLIGYGYLAVLIGIAECLSRRTGLSREVMRKVLHCLIGLEWLVLYYCFYDTWQIVGIPASFIIVNLVSYKFNVFKSIEREKGNHLGTIYYAVAMTGMSIATALNGQLMYPFGIAVVCLSFGDAAAALMGQYCKPRVAVFGKSLWGVIGCFIFSFAAQIALSLLLGYPLRWQYVVALAAICALAEVLSAHGTDNLFVCLWCFVWAYMLYIDQSAEFMVFAAFTGFVLATVCYHTRSFTPIASATAGVMLTAIAYLGGKFAFLFILIAYAVVYTVEHVVKHSRYKETRTLKQIIQNGLWAFVAILAYYLTERTFLLLVYVVSITESLVDSFAGVVGTAYAKTVRNIVSGKPIEKGLSGGVSLVGTIAGLIVSIVSAVVFGAIYGWGWHLLAVALLPFAGMLLDSILGSTLQHKERCTVCGAICECTAHCSRPTQHAAGYRFFSNGNVNLISNFATTAVATLLLYFLL